MSLLLVFVAKNVLFIYGNKNFILMNKLFQRILELTETWQILGLKIGFQNRKI